MSAKNFVDLTGKVFHRLTVINIMESYRNADYFYNCLCICGNHKKVRGGNLRSGQVKSCRCLLKEKLLIRNISHGLTGHPLHNLWFKIKERCENVNCKSYSNYGGRGIMVCERWKLFQNFYDDMITGYAKGLEIDRINNNGNYEPSNCRWVSHRINTQNTRKTKLSTEIVEEIRNSTLPAPFFAKKYNTSRSVINNARKGKTWAN